MEEDLTDFTSFCDSRKANKTPIHNLQDPAKLGLIETRLNKDNFWNLMFALGMTIGSLTIGLFLTILIVPFILKYFSKVSFVDGKFLNSQGKELSIQTHVPNGTVVIVTTIIGTMFVISNLTPYLKNIPEIYGTASTCLCLFFIPTLFFNFKNCPISILFNGNFWQQTNNQMDDSIHISRKSLAPDYVTNPVHRNMPINLFHKRN